MKNEHGLVNYWPISDGTMNDIIGGMHMQQGNFTTYAADRFGNANSALNLNGGYTYVPPGVYFNSAFTISAWVYPDTLGSWARLIDFGNGESIDNVILSFSYSIYNRPTLSLYNLSTNYFITSTSLQLTENIWYFLAASFNGTCAKMFVNGTISSSCTLISYTMPNNVIRAKNYIGKSNYAVDGYSSSLVDDLRIYNRCLDDIEIQNLMINGG